MNNVMFIVLCCALILIVIIIAVLLYNQMLILNEVNKRLLLLAKESVDKERSTQEALSDALRELDAMANDIKVQPTTDTTASQEDEEIFDW